MKVVCIMGPDETVPGCAFTGKFWNGDPPVKGRVYTVIAKEYCIYWEKDVYRLAEISNDRGYWVGRFRPVKEVKTDISIFTKMLTDKKVKERS